MAAIGIVAGLGAAALATRLMSDLLVGITPRDPLTFGGGEVLLLMIAAAGAIAARRAYAGRSDRRSQSRLEQINSQLALSKVEGQLHFEGGPFESLECKASQPDFVRLSPGSSNDSPWRAGGCPSAKLRANLSKVVGSLLSRLRATTVLFAESRILFGKFEIWDDEWDEVCGSGCAVLRRLARNPSVRATAAHTVALRACTTERRHDDTTFSG